MNAPTGDSPTASHAPPAQPAKGTPALSVPLPRPRGRSRSLVRLSELTHRPAVDRRGARARVRDFSVDLAAGDYPPVRGLLIHCADGLCSLPWRGDTTPRGELLVDALAAAQPVDEDALTRMVLLRRDIQDALILDVAGQRAVRANDLWLRRAGEQLVLTGADISPWAVLRRLSRGLLGHGRERNVLDWQWIEFLRGDPEAAAAGRDYHRVITTLAPAQIAQLADALPYPHAAELLGLLPDALAADVLERMVLGLQAQVAAALAPSRAAALLALMADDTAADVLALLELADATRLLERMPPDRAVAVENLLRFPADTAGGIMTTDFVTAPVGLTVGEALDYIRPQLERPDFFAYVYLVDEPRAGRLRGVVTLRHLVLGPGDTPVEQVMTASTVTIGPLEPALVAADRIAQLDLSALPVVGPDGRLLGIITVDAAMRQLTPEAWQDRVPRVFS
ncbi:MAG TPA: CBS domain-containing protein [Chloroflexota bacterium]|nr:CBS domain-containing protein [Chloroflexota bacterium]